MFKLLAMDNLEQFFKNHASKANIEFEEQDWRKLETRLDREMPVLPLWRRLLTSYGWIPALLILSITGWLILPENNHDSNTIINTQNLSSLSAESTSPTKTPTAKSTDSDREMTFSTNASTTLKTGEPTMATHEALAPSAKKPTDRKKYTTFIPAEQNKTAGQNLTSMDNTNYDQDTGYADKVPGADDRANPSASVPDYLYPIPPEYPLLEVSVAVNKTDIIDKKIGKNPYKSGLNIGVGYSPDFSTVGIKDFVSPGTRWKLMAEYDLSRRFSLHTGLVWVNNKYEARGSEYHAPARYWKNGIVADEAYGTCEMIDIPVNVSFHILQSVRSRLSLSGGASTYFVNKEDYDFDYYNQQNPSLPQHWGTDKTTVYPFGIINLSIEYQLGLGPKSALQAAPFIKIPTTGIGWGKVDLHTMGVYILYKYRLINTR